MNNNQFNKSMQTIKNYVDEKIPTKTSQLTNDSNFLTSVPSEYITESELEGKGYLTEHQDLSGFATKEYVDEYTGGKKQVFLNKAEYDLLTDAEKNNKDVIYNIMDVENFSTPSDLIIDDNLLHLVDDDGNKIGNGVVLDISSSTTTSELILSSPSGQLYKLIVDDSGNLSTVPNGYQPPNLFNKECVKAGAYDATEGTITGANRWDYFIMVPVESGKSYNIKFDTRARIIIDIVGEDESTVIHARVADTGTLTTTGDYSSFSYTSPITSAAGFIRFQLAQETYTPFIMNISVMEA